jgi:hypothetical protein
MGWLVASTLNNSFHNQSPTFSCYVLFIRKSVTNYCDENAITLELRRNYLHEGLVTK